jgi:hypothetical protein
MRFTLSGWLTLVLVFALVGTATAEGPITKTDRRGPVTVAVTPASSDGVVRVKVALDTHSVGLDDIALDRAVVLKAADGSDVVATSMEPAAGGGHHRSAVLVFPAPASNALQVVVRGVGGVAERTFTWEPWPAR